MKVPNPNTCSVTQKLLFLLLLLVCLLLFCACAADDDSPEDVTRTAAKDRLEQVEIRQPPIFSTREIPVTESVTEVQTETVAEAITETVSEAVTEAVTEPLPQEQESYVSVKEINALPKPYEESLFCAVTSDRNWIVSVYEEGLDFYIELNNHGYLSFSKARLVLPDGYTSGAIVGGCGTSEDRGLLLHVRTKDSASGETVFLTYRFREMPYTWSELKCGKPWSNYVDETAAEIQNPLTYDVLTAPQERTVNKRSVRGFRFDVVDALPADPEDSLFYVRSYSMFPMMLVYEECMTFYWVERGWNSDLYTMNDYYHYNECEFQLPDGYINGKLIGGNGGAGSEEYVFYAEATDEKTGEITYFMYTVISDNGPLMGGSAYRMSEEEAERHTTNPDHIKPQYRDLEITLPPEYYDRGDIVGGLRDALPSAESSVECSVTMTEITSLPAPPDDTMFCAYGSGCPPAYLFYEPGTMFYRLDYYCSPETLEDQYRYYEYELHLPEQFSDVCFLGGGRGGGSAEVMLYLEAKNAESARREYYCLHFQLSDNDAVINADILIPIPRSDVKQIKSRRHSYDKIRQTFQSMRESALKSRG